MTLLNLIKRAAAEAVDASNPVQVLYGEVIAADPLAVQVDQRFILTTEFLVVPEGLAPYTVDLRHSHGYDGSTTGSALADPVVIRRGLEAGDKVILLRTQGGQQYVILDRVVSA